MSRPRPEPAKFLLVTLKSFENCKTEIAARLRLVRLLKDAGFRLDVKGEPEDDWERLTKRNGRVMEFRQWPCGTLLAWEASKMKRTHKMNGGTL